MENAANFGLPEDGAADSPCHASFILRCWIGQGQHVRIRLIDVSTGIIHTVGNPEQVPALLRRLIANMSMPKE